MERIVYRLWTNVSQILLNQSSYLCYISYSKCSFYLRCHFKYKTSTEKQAPVISEVQIISVQTRWIN
jgi:hypothetical protein